MKNHVMMQKVNQKERDMKSFFTSVFLFVWILTREDLMKNVFVKNLLISIYKTVTRINNIAKAKRMS